MPTRRADRALAASLVCLCLSLAVPGALAHPGSGIVVDADGQVYFVDTGRGVWKLDREGRLTPHEGPAFHWMTIDTRGAFAERDLPSVRSADLRKVGFRPALILSSDFPVTLGRDGALYWPELSADGRVQILRHEPSSGRSVMATLPAATESGPLRWLNGLAAGPDGSIYYTENRAIRAVSMPPTTGAIRTIAGNLALQGCGSVPGVDPDEGPYLRGLDVAADGTVYAAASGCGSVIRVAPSGTVSTLLRTESPWSPTGVAVSGDSVYVLEYLHTASDDRREWLPRVRRISSDGRDVILAVVEAR